MVYIAGMKTKKGAQCTPFFNPHLIEIRQGKKTIHNHRLSEHWGYE